MRQELENAVVTDVDINGFITDFNFRDMSLDRKFEYEPQRKLLGTDCNFYRLDKITYENDHFNREFFHAAFNSLKTKEFNLVFIIDGYPDGVNFYIGCAKNSDFPNNSEADNLYASDYAYNIRQIISGHMVGSEISEISQNELNCLMNPSMHVFKKFGILSGIPSESGESEQKHFLGVEHLVNAMSGDRWRIMIVADRLSDEEVVDYQNEIYRLYQDIDRCSKININSSRADNNSSSHSDDYHENDGRTKSCGKSYNSKVNDDDTNGWNSSDSRNFGTSIGYSDSSSEGTTRTTSYALELRNKKAEEIKKYVDEQLLPKLQMAAAKGFFRTSVYCLTSNTRVWKKLENNLTNIFQSDKSCMTPLMLHEINLDTNFDYSSLMGAQNIFRNQINDVSVTMNCLFKRRCQLDGRYVLYSSLFTIDELTLIASLPSREVTGLDVVKSVDFGLNLKYGRRLDFAGDDRCDGVCIGNVIHNGFQTKTEFTLSPQLYSKHIFIAGVTGSGKTTTCQTLLKSAGCNFLVIEPAKTEYRSLMNIEDFSDLVVFTVGNDRVAPFCINPFEVVKGENFTAHIDMLKATMVSSSPMEGSMPQIIEEAIYSCYESKGWNTMTGENDEGKEDYPMMEDFVRSLSKIAKSKGFSDRLASDYVGTLVSRFSNLLVGAKGRIFNCKKSNFGSLVDRKVVIEIENLKSPEDKCLLMGFILSHVSEEVRRRHSENKNFRHITLIEEAHKLLSKVEFGDSGSKKQAVEVFSDLLAEIRKYGEGYIVVDQIPSKLTPEILKNTNTKFIHRLFAADDKDMVGSCMSMTEEQSGYLSQLGVGECVAFSENMSKPVLLKIRQLTDTSDNDVEDSLIREQFRKAFPNEYELLQIKLKYLWLMRDRLRSLSRSIKNSEDFSSVLNDLGELGSELKQTVSQMEQAQDITVILGLKENDDSFLRNVTDELFHILLRKYRLNLEHTVADYRSLADLLFGLLYKKSCLDDVKAQQRIRNLCEIL